MIIKEATVVLQTPSGPMDLVVIQPNLPSYPDAKWPGVVCWAEIYQVTAPVRRFAASIASQGYSASSAASHDWP
jgi:dienelactone hydrolase